MNKSNLDLSLNEKKGVRCQMSLSTNKALVKSFVEEVFNKLDLSSIEKYLTEQGSEGFKQFLSEFFTAFPDIHANIEHLVAENDLVVVFLNFTGTHKGEYQERPSTNKQVTTRSADLYRIENEKIVEHWDVVDQLNLLQQTGAITFDKLNKK
jgi:predicted ester cyclase